MADIEKIKVGTLTYNIKDSSALHDGSAYVLKSGDTMTGALTAPTVNV